MRQDATSVKQDATSVRDNMDSIVEEGTRGQGALDPQEPPVAETPAAAKTKVSVASQWQLMRWRFGKHKLAVVSLWVIVFFYLVALFVEVIAPADPNKTNE